MKEYLDNEGVCFGVDCIRSYSEIRKLTQASIQACDQLLQVVKCRVQAEDVHASALTDISQMPLTYISGSLQDCMSQLQSDTKHKGSQHRILADSLTEEVIQPITLLRDQMSKKEIVLYSQYTNMNKELKQLEDSFKKNSVQYEKLYQTATSNISTCRKHGISNDEFKQLTELAANEPQVNKSLATTWNSLTNLTLTSTNNLLATREKGKDWLNWAVASASGTPTPTTAAPTTPLTSTSASVSASSVSTPLDKKGLCVMTLKTLAKLEKCRVVTRKAWLDFVIVSQRYAVKTQILLTKLQGMQESFILILQDHLRKIVVVESSFLANQQYDIQMLFKVMEEIDVREDMRQFILKNANTPLDLYESESESDEENEEGDAGVESDVDRNRSASYDGDEHDVEIVIEDQVGGKPSISAVKKKSTAQQMSSVFENKNEIWGESPWTSDIFPSLSSKLKHIKELPLPPCEDTMTFSSLKSILIEKHLDALDKNTSSSLSFPPGSSSALSQHQYMAMERVRDLSRLSLVSRHIDMHNCLAGEGQAGSSLARLEIATSTQKKKNSVRMHSLLQSSQVSSPSSSSPPPAATAAENTTLLSHPLTSSDVLLNTPLTPAVTPMREDRNAQTREGEKEEEEEEEEDELMTYGTAEEALEKMIVLQTRIRPQWAALIEAFSQGSGSGNVSTQDSSSSGATTDPDSHQTSGEKMEVREGTVEDSGNVLVSSAKKENTFTNNPSYESLDELVDTDAGILSRNLKDADNATTENVDSVKCREIMNSFGLLDAVSVDVDDDHWHEGSGQGGVSQPLSLSLSSVNNLSPQSVTGQNPHQQDKSALTPTYPMVKMPFLSTTKSDYSDNSINLDPNSTTKESYTASFMVPSDQLVDSLTTTDDDGGGGKFSMSHFGSATPESLDFLSS